MIIVEEQSRCLQFVCKPTVFKKVFFYIAISKKVVFKKLFLFVLKLFLESIYVH